MNNTLQHFATKTVKRKFKSKGVSWKNPYKFKEANNDFDIEFNHAIFKNRDSKNNLIHTIVFIFLFYFLFKFNFE